MESEISKIKAEKFTMQKSLIKEREEKQKLFERNEELEAWCKRKTEEIEALQLCNHQLVHKCEALQEKVSLKSSSWGSSWWSPSGKNQKKIESIKILEEELQNKISENEQVHIKNFEQRQHYKKKIQDLKTRIKYNEEIVRQSAEKIESMAIEIMQYQSSIQSLFKENKEYLNLLDTKNKEIQDSHNYFLKITNEYKDKISLLQNKLRSVVSLDLTEYETYTIHNAPKFNRNFQFKQNEWLLKIWQSLDSSSLIIQGFLNKYCTRLDLLHSNSNKTCKKIVSEIWKNAEKLNQNYSGLIKIITDKQFFNTSEIIKCLGRVESNFIYFFRLIKLELVREEDIIQDFDKISKINNDLSNFLAKIGNLISRGISFIMCSAYSKHSLWNKIQEICKNLNSSVVDIEKNLKERLALDKILKYKVIVKDTQQINEDILIEFQRFSSFFNHFCSEIMQLRSPFYYSLNPLYHSTSTYLQDLRKNSSIPGIPYVQSLENLKLLTNNEIKIKEQFQSIQNVEKQNHNLQKEIDKYKAEITKFENELAAVEQNLERRVIGDLTDAKQILHEHESISDDVKNGAQRFALRLTDFHGEAIPISTISVNNDIYLKIQEIALNKINELAEKIKNS